jgi:transmembrane protein EpsG
MIFYLALFSSVMLLSSNVELQDTKLPKYQNLIFLAFILLLLAFGFRYGFGIDYPSYLGIFDRIGNNWSQENLEPGFYYLNHFIKSLGGNAYHVIFISFLLALVFLHQTIVRYSDFPEISYLVFFSSGMIFFYSSGIRQATALSICFFALRYLPDKQFYHFLIVVLLASTFHLTALVFIPFYFLSRIKYQQWLLALGYLASLAFIYKPTLIVQMMSPVIELVYGDRFGGLISTALAGGVQNTGLGLKLLFLNFLVIMVIWRYNQLNRSPVGLILTNFFIIGQLMVNVLGGIPDINRITLYFSMFNVLFIPYVISRVENQDFRVSLYVFFLSSFTLLLIRYLQSDVYGAIPYRSIFY